MAQNLPNPQLRTAAVENYRQKFILEKLKSCQSVLTVDLSTELGVSKITIRRDLTVLSERGYLTRTHGGAKLLGSPLVDCFMIKRTQN